MPKVVVIHIYHDAELRLRSSTLSRLIELVLNYRIFVQSISSLKLIAVLLQWYPSLKPNAVLLQRYPSAAQKRLAGKYE